MTRYASPSDVEAKAAEWTPAQFACRLNKYHDWTDRRLTMLSRSHGTLTVQQWCARGCGVGRKATMNLTSGYLTSPWRRIQRDTTEAKQYAMVNHDGESLGRIGEDGQARLRLAFFADINVVEVDTS